MSIPSEEIMVYPGIPIDEDWEGEDIGRYCPGGLHPIDLGDFLDSEARFKVVHKLGNGGFATVWLCRDNREGKWRAIKILEAEFPGEDCAEMRFLKLLADANALEEAASNHIVLPLEHFYITGPNGRHLCFVLPIYSGPISDIWNLETVNDNIPLLKEMCYQAAEGLAFLHSKGICHGDFRPNNVLLRVEGIDDLPEEELMGMLRDPYLYDLGDDPSMPRNLVFAASISTKSPYVVPEIGIVDFGESFHISNPPQFCGIPPGYQAPEIVLGCNPGFGMDIWALVCLIGEVRHRNLPTCSSSNVLDLVMEWEELIGPLPEPLRTTWIEEGCRPWSDLGAPPEEIPLSEPVSQTRADMAEWRSARLRDFGFEDFLESRYRSKKKIWVWETEGDGGDKTIEYMIPEDEASQLIDLFRATLKYCPQERPTAKDIMQHSWFDGRSRKHGQIGTIIGVAKTVATTCSRAAHWWDLNGIRPLLLLFLAP